LRLPRAIVYSSVRVNAAAALAPHVASGDRFVVTISTFSRMADAAAFSITHAPITFRFNFTFRSCSPHLRI